MRNSSEKIPNFGGRLKAARIAAGFTQQTVADTLGLTLRTYQRYESGTSEPTLFHLVSLSIFLSVSSDYLLGLTDEAPAG